MSSTDLGAIFNGDINILVGASTSDQGFGDLTVARNVSIDGTTTSTSPTSGALVVAGGAGITENLYVDGVTNLDQTNIVTDDGTFGVTGSGTVDFNVTAAISFDAAGASNFTTSSGNMTVNATSGTAAFEGSTAVTITSSAGGITGTAAGNSSLTTSSGTMTISSTDASGGTVTVSSADAAAGAVTIDASDAAGGVAITAGTSGITADATGGAISLDATGAASNFTVAASGDAQDLTISVTGVHDSSVILSSSGTSATDAILLQTTAGGIQLDANQDLNLDGANAVYVNSALGAINVGDDNVIGNINIGTAGARTIAVGSGSATTVTVDASGAISLDSGANSNFSTSAGTLTLTGADGATLQATGGAGSAQVSILSNDTTNGISIGTATSGVPITIGNATSETTIGDNLTVTGNLTVNGTTTTIDSTTLTVEDTIITVNSKPSGTGNDSGMANKRYQAWSDSVAGDVVADTAAFQLTGTATISDSSTTVTGSGTLFTTEIFQYNQIIIDGQTKTVTAIADATSLTVDSAFTTSKDGQLITSQHTSAFHNGSGDTGTAQSGTATTITLNDAASSVDSAYNGWWVEITGGTGANQIRRIKTYVGSTRVATIYSTADETATPSTPAQGHDFTTSADNTSTYSLHRAPFVGSVYDESADEWTLVGTNDDPATSGAVTITKYLDMHAGDGDFGGTVHVDQILEHSSNHGVLIDGVLIRDGTITGTISGTAENVNLVDNLSGVGNRVQLTTADTRGSFLIVVQSQANDGACAVFSCSSNSTASAGDVARLTADRGAGNENINMTWQATEQPALYYITSVSGGSGANVPYDIAITKVG